MSNIICGNNMELLASASLAMFPVRIRRKSTLLIANQCVLRETNNHSSPDPGPGITGNNLSELFPIPDTVYGSPHILGTRILIWAILDGSKFRLTSAEIYPSTRGQSRE